MRRGSGGTETARPLDVGRAAQALRFPGIDPRHWLSYGTVCTINEDGSANFTDGSAIAVTPTGVTVDVLLMPANQHVPCRYGGVQGGASGTIYTPIHAGDEVIVGIPDGDLRLPPVILAIMSGEHSPLPLDEDRTPLFKNDRILVHAPSVPVEVRSGASKFVVNSNGNITADSTAINLNSGDKGAARQEDTTKLTLSIDDLNALAPRILAPPGSGGGPCTAAPGPDLVFEKGEITSSSGSVKIGD